MQSRLPISMAAVLTTLIAGVASTAAAMELPSLSAVAVRQAMDDVWTSTWEPPRLVALAARHDLRDEVCFAQADGRITRLERYIILTDAKKILTPDQYKAFRRAFYQLPSQEHPPAKHTAERTTKRPVKVVRKSPVPTARRKTVPLPESSLKPTIPTEVVTPERVVVNGGVW